MGIVSGIVVYLLVWWLTLFAVLPWGIQKSPGYAGAPVNPRLKMKFIATSGVAALIWLAIFFTMKLNVISFHDIAARMMQEDGLK